MAETVHQVAKDRAEKPAIVFGSESKTYGQLWNEIEAVSAALSKTGLNVAERVALLLPNSPEFVVAFFSVQAIGGVAVPMNSRLPADEIGYLVRDSNPRLLLTTVDLFSKVRIALRPLLGNSSVVIWDGETDGCIPLERLLQVRAEAAFKCRDMEADSPAAVIYTSGTTGKQKGAVQSQGNVIFHETSARLAWGVEWEDRVMMFLPLSHSFGLTVANTALCSSATLVLHSYFDVGECVSSVKQNQVSMFFGVPTAYIKILDAGVGSEAFSTVRFFFSTGARLPLHVSRDWQEKFGRQIYQGYGLTEAVNVTFNHKRKLKSGSIGSPIDSVGIRIVDDSGSEVPIGKPGEVTLKGPNVMIEYWNRPDETHRVLSDHGWLRTGDVGYVDEEGYYFLVDRINEVINVSGFKVWPYEVEELLCKHRAVKECAVVGIEDPVKGEEVKAFIVLNPGENVTFADLQGYCREHLASYKVPRLVEFTQEIPKNSSGKILKKLLAKKGA